MIIDAHTHAFPDPLAARALESLSANAGGIRPFHDGTVAGLIRSMDAAGVDRSVLCPIATRPDQQEGILRWVLAAPRERIIPFAS
ncbi:MAG: amidohydrolase, partial [Planctomycetes bacterium]|nr:amidohydrolase [Planctomycetota bacterium]